jgi:hypothetical protein
MGLVSSKMILCNINLEIPYVGGLETQMLEGNIGDEKTDDSMVVEGQSTLVGLTRITI